MSVVAFWAEAEAAGVRLGLTPDGRARVAGRASPELIGRLRAHKAELVQALRGDRCRRCGEPMGWPRPAGVVLGDGTAAHQACRERAEVGRCVRLARAALSPEALADEAEVMGRGDPLP